MASRGAARATRALTPRPPVGLYVHVPFCISVCPYCDFVVYAGSSARGPAARVDVFLDAVRAELRLRADVLDARTGPPGSADRRAGSHARPPLASLYLGGGTPSLLNGDAIADLIGLVRDRFGLAADAEVTIEVNPGPDERGDPAAHAAAGVTRVSIGAQALDDRTLRRIGRRHRARDVADAVAAARVAGIGSVGLDLLYDLPDQAPEDWARTLDAAVALGPDHLSLYALALDDPEAEGLTGARGDHLPVRAGARRWRDRARTRQDEDRAAVMYELATDRLAAAGYRGYEISNWATPGHESRHNLAYWRRLPIEAVGPGAHAFDGVERRWNAGRLDAYVAALLPRDGAAPALPPGGSETLDPADAATEALVLGLRLAEGVPTASFGVSSDREVATWARSNGLLTDVGEVGEVGEVAEVAEIGRSGGRVALTTRGRLLSNELFARLI